MAWLVGDPQLRAHIQVCALNSPEHVPMTGPYSGQFVANQGAGAQPVDSFALGIPAAQFPNGKLSAKNYRRSFLNHAFYGADPAFVVNTHTPKSRSTPSPGVEKKLDLLSPAFSKKIEIQSETSPNRAKLKPDAALFP